MAKDDDDQWSKWLDGERDRTPAASGKPSGMTDEELSRAICKVAIDQGIDPNNHGVIPAAEMLSPELAESRRVTASLIQNVAKQLGLSTEHAKDNLEALGLLPVEEPPQKALVATEDEGQAATLTWEGGDDEVALAKLDVGDQLELIADAIAAAKHYDKWLRPLGVMMLAFAGASALGAGVGTGAIFFALGYGVFCNGFSLLDPRN